MGSFNTMFAQPCTVLMLNNNTFVIVIDMTEKQDSGGIKDGIATDDNREAKATATIPMAGAIVTAALLLSGLSIISSYPQPVMAQQNMTGGGGGGGADNGITTSDNATTTTITGGAAQGGNATNATSAGGAVNQSASQVRMNIEQARMALQNDDTQGAMMYLDMALSALGGDGAGGAQGNTTSNTTIAGGNAITTGSQNRIPPVGGTSAADVDNEIAEDDNDADDRSSSTDANRPETDTEEEENSECGGVTVGGTSAADDYGCPPDPDY
jgi:hypothetical protein